MYDLVELMDRVVAMQKEAVQGCDASPDWNHTQEAFPYWINRIASMVADPTMETQPIDRYVVLMRFVIGHLTENYLGLDAQIAYQAIPQVLSFFRGHSGFTSLAYPERMDFLIDAQAEITALPNGVAYFQHNGMGGIQFGFEMTLEAPLISDDIP